MKLNGLYISEETGHYFNVIQLYNNWITSCVNTNNIFNNNEWQNLINYCKSNKHETCNFFIELCNAYCEAYVNGYIGSPYIGASVKIMCYVFPDAIQDMHIDSYKDIQKEYETYVNSINK